MKKTKILSILLFLFLFGCKTYAIDFVKEIEIKKLTSPFLDSLKIVKDEKVFAQSKLIFESLTSLIPDTPESFSNFSIEENFSTCQPINDNLYGLITPPIEIFNGGRIALIYFMQDIEKNSYLFYPLFQFRSNIEKDKNGDSFLQQQLVVTVENITNIMNIRFAFIDVEIWNENIILRQKENDPPIARRTLSISTEDGTFKTQYFYKNKEGIYSLTDFEEGAGKSEPEFIGGKTGIGNYISENMRYPEKARKNNITGIVVVEMDISENGEVTSSRVIAGSNSYLDEEALRLARNSSWMWVPAQQNGEYIPGTTNMSIHFQPDLYPEENGQLSGSNLLIYAVVIMLIFSFSFRKEIIKWIKRKKKIKTI